MADAPAGGSGWGATEIIVAVVLGIGVITTLTGGSITPILGTPDTKKVATVKSPTATGCTIIVSRPKTKEKINTEVSVYGSFPECIAATSIPDTINAQVVDSKGTPLSLYTALPVSKGFLGLGTSTFSGTVPLSGTAQSTTGYLILTSPARADGSYLTTRVAIQFVPGSSIGAPAGATGGSYFVPNPSVQTQTTTYTNTPTYTAPTQTYVPPAQNNPPSNGSSSGSNTF